jgi:hypothetical protein
MNSELFCEWKRHFISVVKPMPEEKALLILEGHGSHIQSLAATKVLTNMG